MRDVAGQRKTWRTRWRRPIRRLVALGVFVMLATLLAGWLAFQHKPGWYRAVTVEGQESNVESPDLRPSTSGSRALTDGQRRRARRAVVKLVDGISDRMVLGQPFDVVIKAKAINEWSVILPEFYPEARIDLPPDLSQPSVAFVEGQVRLAALWRWGESRRRDQTPQQNQTPQGEQTQRRAHGLNAIVSLGCVAQVTDDGRTIRIALANVQGGSLPIPRIVLAPLIRLAGIDLGVRVADGIARALAGINGQDRIGRTSNPQSTVAKSALDDLYRGVEIPNRFTWPNGDRLFRIDSIRFLPGEAWLRIEPL